MRSSKVSLKLFCILMCSFSLLRITDSAVLTCEAENDEDWSYHGLKNGPSAWGETFPYCYGREQSPVAIHTHEAVRDKTLSSLLMKNYVKPVTKATIANNGHSVQITPQDGVARTIEVEGSTYTLQQFHFHWGSDYNIGSEHTLDNKAFALEAHFVHTNSRNNIAVVGVFFETVQQNNSAFDPLTEVLHNIKFEGKSVILKSPLHLDDFIPSNPSPFYRYQGSLTTPGCNEGVVWSILKGEKKMGVHQLDMFRDLYSVHENDDYVGCKLKDNFRPVQPLNGRVIYKSFK